jgi:hypothetical protein
VFLGHAAQRREQGVAEYRRDHHSCDLRGSIRACVDLVEVCLRHAERVLGVTGDEGRQLALFDLLEGREDPGRADPARVLRQIAPAREQAVEPVKRAFGYRRRVELF